MPISIAIMFFIVSTGMFLWTVLKNKKELILSPTALLPALKTGGIIALPFMAVFGLSKVADFAAAYGVWSFALGVIGPCVVAKMVPSAGPRSLLLLILSVLAYYIIPEHNLYQVESLFAGLLVWKCAANLLTKGEKQLQDVLPSFVWLTVLCWSTEGGINAATAAQQQGLILGAITVAFILNWLGERLLTEDRFYIKRVVISSIGGVAVLGVISRMIVVGHLDRMAILAGVGFLGAYLFDSMDKQVDETAALTKTLKQLILIGIFTLIATRMFDTLGSVLLASTMIAVGKSRGARMAAFFWCGKALAQAFVMQFNPNVTGINLEHAYTSAGLYAGFLSIVFLLVALRDVQQTKLKAGFFVATITAAPVAAEYFIHSEPTSSFLVAATVAGVMLAASADCLFRKKSEEADTIILAPGAMALMALLANEVLLKGDEATAQHRLIVVGVLAFITIAVMIVQKIFGDTLEKGRFEPAESSPV